MTPHYTSNTEGDYVWCNTCGRKTLHSVTSNRLGRCTEHDAPKFSKKQIEQREHREQEQENPKLF